jgi:peptide deformylase
MNNKYSKNDIITLPDRRLREKSQKVQVIDDDILQLVERMKEVALDWEQTHPHELATALSAVQLGVLKRVVILRETFDDKENQNFIALINPEIVKYEGSVTREPEGCLSVKSIYGLVPRHEKVRLRAVDITGREVRFKSPEPFMARILQHEVDHTNGICFVDRIDDHDAFFVLNDSGELQPIKYEEVVKMGILLE